MHAAIRLDTYLVVDLSQDTPEHMRLQTNVFPDQMHVVYVPKV